MLAAENAPKSWRQNPRKLNNSVESRRQWTRTELQKGCEKHSEITPHQQKMKK